MRERPVMKLLSASTIRSIVHGKKPKDILFIASFSRSGSTWLANLVNFRNEYRYIFEPIFPGRVELFSHYHRKQYLRPEDDDPVYLEPMKKLLGGRYYDRWIDVRTRRYRSARMLIKEIRGNLLLGWLKNHFPHIKLVLLIRHPLATAHSNVACRWPGSFAKYLSQPALVNDYLHRYVPIVERCRSSIEKKVLQWCIEHSIAFEQLTLHEYYPVFYESLYTDPEGQLKNLFRYAAVEWDPHVLGSVAVPSHTSREKSAVRRGGSPLNQWRSKVKEDVLRRSMRILESFGLHRLYGEDDLPARDAAEQVRRFSAGGIAQSSGQQDTWREYGYPG
jgi:hypothetical protein